MRLRKQHALTAHARELGWVHPRIATVRACASEICRAARRAEGPTLYTFALASRAHTHLRAGAQ
eukprot:scaffold132872_cov35-Tisochrysis_lutea.AAC.1